LILQLKQDTRSESDGEEEDSDENENNDKRTFYKVGEIKHDVASPSLSYERKIQTLSSSSDLHQRNHTS